MGLTNRMSNWIEVLGAHVALTEESGYPYVVVVESLIATEDQVRIGLDEEKLAKVTEIISKHDRVAIAPGGLGSIRAPYQFKGIAHLEENKLVIDIDEIYSTKPGPEAGIRLDVLGEVGIKEFDESRWQDLAPEA